MARKYSVLHPPQARRSGERSQSPGFAAMQSGPACTNLVQFPPDPHYHGASRLRAGPDKVHFFNELQPYWGWHALCITAVQAARRPGRLFDSLLQQAPGAGGKSK